MLNRKATLFWQSLFVVCHINYYCSFLKGYSSDQSHLSEINVKLAEENKYATHSVQRF